MARGWDDDPWYDEGGFPPVASDVGRGGLVAAAVVSFVMCAFNALTRLWFAPNVPIGAIVQASRFRRWGAISPVAERR